MKYKIYTTYDSKSESYTLPFYYPLDAQAIRTFTDWVNDPDHPFGKHPEDYTLFSIGEYDATMATVTQEKIISIGNGLQFKNEEIT